MTVSEHDTQTEMVLSLEHELRTAEAIERDCIKAAEAAIKQVADMRLRLLRAQREEATSTINAATQIERAEIDQAISQAAQQINSCTGIVAEVGDRRGWGRELGAAIERAREAATTGEIPAVIAIRPLDQVGGDHRQPGVGLFLELTGRLPQPQSTLNASELARRRGSR